MFYFFIFLFLFHFDTVLADSAPTYQLISSGPNHVVSSDIGAVCNDSAGYDPVTRYGSGSHWAQRTLLAGRGGYGTCMLIDASGNLASMNEGSWSFDLTPVCPAQTVLTNGVCVTQQTQPQNCNQGNYRDSTGSCSIVPPCPSGQFFDVNAEPPACFPNSGTINSCSPTSIAAGNTQYCEPINDCVSTMYNCSNNPADVAAAQAAANAPGTGVQDSKQKATDSAAVAANQAAIAANAAAALQGAAQNAVSIKLDADQIYHDAINNNPPDAPLVVQAANQDAAAADAAAQATQKAANSKAAAQDAAAQDATASHIPDQIITGTLGPGSNATGPNNANALATDAANAAAKATADAVASLTGTSINGSGSSGGGSSQQQTCLDCPEIDKLMAGTANTFKAKTTSTFDISVATDAKNKAQSDFDAAYNQDKANLLSLISISSRSGSGSLPDINYGVMHIAGSSIPVSANYSQYNSEFASLGTMVIFLAAFLSVAIFFV